MDARTVPRSNRSTRSTRCIRRTSLAVPLLLALVLATSAQAITDEEPVTADGVLKLLRYLRCAVGVALAYDIVTAGATMTDCMHLYMTEAH